MVIFNKIKFRNRTIEDLYEMMLSKQSVFDNSKETISILQNSKLSSSLRSKSSLVIETEKAKFEQSSKTLDILIKSTKQRSMRRNMVKQVNEMKKIKDLSRKREKNPPGIGMEIEESLDFGKYQVAGLQDNENNPQNTSNKYFLEANNAEREIQSFKS